MFRTKYLVLFFVLSLIVYTKAADVELSSLVKMIVKCAEKPEGSRREDLLKELESSGFEFKNKKSDTLFSAIQMSINDSRDSLIKIGIVKLKIFCSGNAVAKIILNPQIIGFAFSNFDFGEYAKGKGIAIDLYKCGSENAGDQSIYAYKNSSNKMKSIYFANEMSCGSHGCGIKIKAYFDSKTLEKDNNLIMCK